MPPQLIDHLYSCRSFDEEEDDSIPLVLVAGFMAPSIPGMWGPLDQLQSEFSNISRNNKVSIQKRRIIYVWPGCCSSIHDRACEIYSQLKGGRVDYGEEHSHETGHERYGRTYEALYPEWSSEKPLHFVGHSLGGTTIYFLQLLLSRSFFPDKTAQSNWIRSITTISTPFRGTTVIYIFGALLQQPGRVYLFSLGGILYRIIHLYERLIPRGLQAFAYDFNVDHWGFGERYGLWECLLKSPWAEGRDNAPFDMTIGRMGEILSDSEVVDESTWYRSFVTSIALTDQHSRLFTHFHIPINTWNFSLASILAFLVSIPLAFMSYLIGCHRFYESDLHHLNSSLFDSVASCVIEEEWWENDGMCSKISQSHPGECGKDSYCVHETGLGWRHGIDPLPGRWHVNEVHPTNHIDLVLWTGTEKQKAFWKELFEYLSVIDRRTQLIKEAKYITA